MVEAIRELYPTAWGFHGLKTVLCSFLYLRTCFFNSLLCLRLLLLSSCWCHFCLCWCMYSVVLLVVACVRKSDKERTRERCRHCANVYDTDTVDCFAKIFS